MTMLDQQAALVAALQDPALYDHQVSGFELIETHISWILLTGEFAYKIKKPVDLGFLDFTTIERRRHFCEEELRLNRRLAPELYLGLVAITGNPASPRIDGPGPAIEWAVRMRQFDPEQQLDRLSATGRLERRHGLELARLLADFHEGCPQAPADGPYGTLAAIEAAVQGNFAHCLPLAGDAERARLMALRTWSEQQTRRLTPLLDQRLHSGHVRECHGDIHLANIALIDDHPVPFDCLEFNPELRWIDTMSELAFLTMDLRQRGHEGLANEVLNAYLEAGGDYDGLPLLRYYEVYRALVRTKVAMIRREQDHDLQDAQSNEIASYLVLAERLAGQMPSYLAITHGLSGSGKSVISERLLALTPAIRARADCERRRLYPDPAERYSRKASDRTYERLAGIARQIIESGMPAIVDATFLQRQRRNRFRELAEALGVPFVILDLHAPLDQLRRWIGERAAAGKDPSEADLGVLEQQIATEDPLSETERRHAISIDTDHEVDFAAILAALPGTRNRNG